MSKYLFRGTSVGFEGNRAARDLRRTSLSRHPLVAYMFAKESRIAGGKAVVLIYKEEEVVGFAAKNANCFAKEEQEIALKLTPTEAYEMAAHEIPLDTFTRAINKMGIDWESYVTKGVDKRLECGDLPEDIIEELVRILTEKKQAKA